MIRVPPRSAPSVRFSGTRGAVHRLHGPQRFLASLLFLVNLLLLPGCSRHPCEAQREKRPGWDERRNTPELPYLDLPEQGLGCGRGQGDGTTLGCPRLLNGDMPLSANLRGAHEPSGPGYHVYMLTSQDGREWSEPVRVATAFSSLGLLVDADTLYLFGSTQIPVLTPYAVITALRTTDLEHWEGCAWNICREVNKGLVDTQPVRLEDGRLRMWYYSVPNLPGGAPFDPATRQGSHALVFADLLDGHFYARGVGLSAPDLADPTVVRFRDRWVLAASEAAHRVVLATSRDGERFQMSSVALEGVSVPYLFVEGEELKLMAQRYIDGAGPWPVLFVSRDGRRFQDRGPLVVGTPARGCTSPVMGRFRGKALLFCATPEK